MMIGVIRKYLKIAVLSLVISTSIHAQVDSVYTGLPDNVIKKQKKETPTWDKLKEKLTFGANFQAWISNPLFIFLSPTIGYQPTKKLNVGLGFIYNYTRANYGSYGVYSQSVFGGHSYVRYLVTDGLFVQLQYDRLHQPDFASSDPNAKTWVSYLMAGGGFRQQISNRAALTTSLMYNLTPSPLSIYYPNRLIIQFGIIAGF